MQNSAATLAKKNPCTWPQCWNRFASNEQFKEWAPPPLQMLAWLCSCTGLCGATRARTALVVPAEFWKLLLAGAVFRPHLSRSTRSSLPRPHPRHLSTLFARGAWHLRHLVAAGRACHGGHRKVARSRFAKPVRPCPCRTLFCPLQNSKFKTPALLQGHWTNFSQHLAAELPGEKLATIFRRPSPWKPALQHETSALLLLQNSQLLERQLVFFKWQTSQFARADTATGKPC